MGWLMTATMPDQRTDVLDVLIIGGGFSGLYELDRLRDLGFSVKVWDSAGDFGGTWWWNCYPGARTDSTGQVYQFEYKDLWKDYDFKELYPGWEGVRDYLHYVDSKLGLRKDVEFSTLAETATWDEDARTWTVTSSDGKQQRANQSGGSAAAPAVRSGLPVGLGMRATQRVRRGDGRAAAGQRHDCSREGASTG